MALNIFITIIAAIFILFLPGFFLSFVFFKHGKIDLIERFALSFALSIAIVPLVVFYTNLLGLPINAVSILLQTTGIIFLTGILLLIQYLRRKK